MKTTTLRELNEELAEKARTELNENSNKIKDDLETLKQWLSKQAHIKARTNDQFLIAFLRGCKYSIERAKEKIDMYYTIRTAIPEFFLSRDPRSKKLQDVMTLGLTVPLPAIEPKTKGRILLVRQGAYDPSKISIVDVTKVSYMITDLMMWEDDNAVVCGQIILVDLKGLSFAHLAEVSISLIKKMTSSIQEAYPIRQKGIHFINPPPIFDKVFKIFYNFMSKKIKERIFVHEKYELLHKHIDKSLLPTEYGGNAGPLQHMADNLKDKLVESSEWFIEDESYKTDESKRPGKPKNADLLFGTQGSFRSLDFD